MERDHDVDENLIPRLVRDGHLSSADKEWIDILSAGLSYLKANHLDSNIESVDEYTTRLRCEFLGYVREPEPRRMSLELCSFLHVPEGSSLTWKDVTKSLCDYISHNGLQDPVDRRKIHLDEKLRALFNCDTMTYPEMQRLLKPHYVKN